jgi:hypothetical protein
VAETVATCDPTGDDILFAVGSDHGMESVAETIDLDHLLIAAGLKSATQSSDVVVAPNGSAALLYFAEPDGEQVGTVARFLEKQAWAGHVFVGDGLGDVGLPTGTAARIAVALKPDERANPYGVSGHSPVVHDPQEPKDATGFGQHGGLGDNEQSPFLFVAGGASRPAPATAARRSSTSRRRCCAISPSPRPASTAARCHKPPN